VVQVPSPPDGVHDRGSQGWSGLTAEVGGRKSEEELPELPDPELGAVVVVEADGEVVVTLPAAGAAGAGGSTANWDPVTTVTSAPSVVGPRAVTTDPESERATAWAAAWSAGVFWA
jgi:hypothetical protein